MICIPLVSSVQTGRRVAVAARFRLKGVLCEPPGQAYGGRHLDASALLMPSVGFLDVDDPRITRTVRAIEKHLMEDGLLLRYDTRRVNDGFAGRRRRVPHLARPSACDDLSFILDHCPGQIAGRVQRGAFLPLSGKKRPRDCCRETGATSTSTEFPWPSRDEPRTLDEP